MDDYRHYVTGFFAHQPEAEGALESLVGRGLPRAQLQLFHAESGPAATELKGENNEVLTNVLVDGAIGTAVGAGIGGLAQLALVAGSVSLFAASPVLAPLAMLGWGAGLGGVFGAAAGANTGVEHKEGWLSDLVRDAIASGQVVLVAVTKSEQETATAREVIEAAVGEVNETVNPV